MFVSNIIDCVSSRDTSYGSIIYDICLVSYDKVVVTINYFNEVGE